MHNAKVEIASYAGCNTLYCIDRVYLMYSYWLEARVFELLFTWPGVLPSPMQLEIVHMAKPITGIHSRCWGLDIEEFTLIIDRLFSLNEFLSRFSRRLSFTS